MEMTVLLTRAGLDGLRLGAAAIVYGAEPELLINAALIVLCYSFDLASCSVSGVQQNQTKGTKPRRGSTGLGFARGSWPLTSVLFVVAFVFVFVFDRSGLPRPFLN